MKVNKAIGFIAAALVSAAPAYAGFHEGDEVTLGGQSAFKVAGFDGMSAQHRAWVTQDRLDNALFLSADKSPLAVSVGRMNGALCVLVGGRNVITADANSAREQGLSCNALANKWADSIRTFLGNDAVAAPYIAALKRPNPLGADLAIVERKLYAPAGTVIPITLQTALNSSTAEAGDRVEGLVSSDVMLGNYVIPAGATVIGELVEQRPGAFSIEFNTLKLKSGTEFPLATASAITDTTFVTASAAHPVCTLGIPANEATSCRIPATIGVGTAESSVGTTLVLRQDLTNTIAVGQPMSLVLTGVTPVAVITRGHTM